MQVFFLLYKKNPLKSLNNRGFTRKEIIIKVFSIIGNLFNILIFNIDVCNTNRKIAKKECKNENIKLGPFNSCGKKRKNECNMFTEKENQGSGE